MKRATRRWPLWVDLLSYQAVSGSTAVAAIKSTGVSTVTPVAFHKPEPKAQVAAVADTSFTTQYATGVNQSGKVGSGTEVLPAVLSV